MKCLECGKEADGKYCSKKCGSVYRVKKHRSKILAEPKKEAEVLKVEAEIKPSIQTQEILAEDRNTIREPNPDWCYERFPNINSSNNTMECHICGKLSLTHRKMCVRVSTNFAYDNCYAVK
jgi:hypothetical protein